MTVVVITPPAPILALDQVKRQIRIESSDTTEDELLADLVATATASLDGPTGWLGRALGQQTLELTCGALPWSGGLDLPYGPVNSVQSVTQDGVVVDPSLYRIGSGAWLRAAPGKTIPFASSEPDAVRVRYVAGWAVTPPVPAAGGNPAVLSRWTGPAPIRHALLMMVARLYASRGEDAAGTLVEDRAIQALLAPYRLFTI